MNDRPLSSHEPHDSLERLHALLADRALFGLNFAEARELNRLLEQHPEVVDDELDLAAAALELALVHHHTEALPESLASRVRESLKREALGPPTRAGSAGGTTRAHGSDGASAANPVAIANGEAQPPSLGALKSGLAVRERLGWLVAAACVLAMLFGWSTSRPPVAPTLVEQRDKLLASDKQVVLRSWTATEDPAAKGASGDVLWSTDAQTGFMRFRGLAANDPKVNQYQLWIFDENQDEKFPIDGGVFNVQSSDNDVIVPIRPSLHVVKPTLFAITVEKPGGVVVSSRARLPLLAKVP